MTEVTQADRDFASRWACIPQDHAPLARDAARHRQAALTTAQAEAEALRARVAELDSIMGEYLPILNALESSGLWDTFAEGTGIATANRYRAALSERQP